MLLIASSANRSYHSNGAEFGEGNDALMVRGDKSKRSSGEFVNSRGSISPVIEFCVDSEVMALTLSRNFAVRIG
jgi:hypothetical protein